MSAVLGATNQVDLTALFSPFSQAFTIPGSYSTQKVPSGASHAVITIRAAGASGASATTNSSNQFGGGGGADSVKTVAINPADWGAAMNFVVGSGGAVSASDGVSGGNSTFSATWNVGFISITSNGGSAGLNTAGGTGGTASGGDTNTSGGNATSGLGGKGGDGGGSGGVGGNNSSSIPQSGNQPGGGGGAQIGPKYKVRGSGRGADGKVQIDWS